MFRLSGSHHQAVQFTNFKLLNCDAYTRMDPYIKVFSVFIKKGKENAIPLTGLEGL
jgi:hypothetical protein